MSHLSLGKTCIVSVTVAVIATITHGDVTLSSGEYSGVEDYSGQKVTIPVGVTISVKPYGKGGDLAAGRLTIIANEIIVAGVINAVGAGYGGGGGGAGAHGSFRSGSGGSTGGGGIDGGNGGNASISMGGNGGQGGGAGGGGGGTGGAWHNSGATPGVGTAGGGTGGKGDDVSPYRGGGGGGGSGNGQSAGNGSVVTGGAGIAGGGRGGDGASDSAPDWDAGGGGGGGGGPFGGNGGAGGSKTHIDGYAGTPGGYLASGANGDSSTDPSVAMGSGGGGGGGGNQSGVAVPPTSPLASGGPGGVEGGSGFRDLSGTGGGGGGGGGAAGGGAIILRATTRIEIAGQLAADGGGKASLGAGHGAGGGILLQSPTVDITGAISSLGGNMTGSGTTTNGGTLKILANSVTGDGGLQGKVGRFFKTNFGGTTIVRPAVSTEPLGDKSTMPTSATLRGKIVDDGGEGCQYRLGIKKEGGSYNDLAWSSSTRTSGETFSEVFTGLSPETTYYFKAEAKNSAGTGSGSEEHFTTPAAAKPPVVSTREATNLSMRSATLHGYLDRDGGEACEYRFRYWPLVPTLLAETHYTPWTGYFNSGEELSAIVTDLIPGVGYSFSVQARNSAGESEWGGVLPFSTLAARKPSAIALPPNAITRNSALLRALLVDDGGDDCEYRFIYQKVRIDLVLPLPVPGPVHPTVVSDQPQFTPWASGQLDGGVFTQQVDSLEPGTLYGVIAQGRNSAGEGPWSNVVAFNTQAIRTPTVSVAEAKPSVNSASLKGTIVDDGGDRCEYEFAYRNVEASDYYATVWKGYRTTGQDFTHTLKGLVHAQTYGFRARARNSAGEGPWSVERTFTTRAERPTMGDVWCSGTTNTSAVLWGCVEDDGGQACQYRFIVKKAKGGTVVISTAFMDSVRSGKSFTYTATGLQTNTSYTFSVTLQNPSGTGTKNSNEFNTRYVSTYSYTPPPPKNLQGNQDSRSGSSSDPVNTATGNLFHSETDMAVSTRAMPLVFARYYNSLDSTGGPLGPGWTHSYNVFLTTDTSKGLVGIQWGDGRADYWNPDGHGGYEPNTLGLYDRLESHADATWSVLTKALNTYHFNQRGRLNTITDKNGNTTSLIYAHPTDPSLVTRVADPIGRTIVLTYDNKGHLAQVGDYASPPRTVSFSYADGRLTQVLDVLGNAIQYAYDAAGHLTTITDQRGVATVSNVYDPTGRVVEQKDGNGNTARFQYETPDPNRTTIIYPDGSAFVHTHLSGYNLLTAIQNPLGQTVQYGYDARGQRDMIADRNANTQYFIYDGRGNVTHAAESDDPNNPNDGGVTVVQFGDPNHPDLPTNKVDAQGLATQWQYDARGNVTRQINPDGSQRTWTYNTSGQKLTETNENCSTTQYVYDANGLLIAVVDPLGNMTHYAYDELWRMTGVTDARGSTAGDPNHTMSTAYDKAGRVISVTGPLTATRTQYDAVGNLIQTTNGRGFSTTRRYDKNNNLTAIERPAPNGQTQITQYAYDARNRLVSQTDPLGNATSYTYDSVGKLASRTNAEGGTTTYTYDAHGNVASVVDCTCSGVTSFYAYDTQNRLIHAWDKLNHHQYRTYDDLSRLIAATDATGQATRYEYDVMGRLTAVIDAAGGRTEYAYDAIGSLTQVVDAAGKTVSTRAYDMAGRLVQKTDGLASSHLYVYDAVGNLVLEQDAEGQMKVMVYDNENRLSEVRYPDSNVVRFTYDGNKNVTRMVDPTGTSESTYDELDRLTSSKDGFGQLVQYSFDLAGNRTAITYPGDASNPARMVRYSYDKANRLDKIVDWENRTWDYTVDPGGRITGLQYPNGVRQTRVYDDAGRLMGLGHKRADGSAVVSFAYTRDAAGNPTEVAEVGTLNPMPDLPASENYTYDEDNRLRETDRPASYGYDKNGNVTTRNANGRTVSFSFDFENRLVSQALGGSAVQHTYDGLGNRIARTASGSTTRYILDRGRDMSHVLCETDSSGRITAYYIHGPEIVGRVAADGSIRYYHSNDIGSVTALTDNTQAVTDRYAYTPFGVPSGTEGTTPNPFRYVGGLGVMAETDGLYFMRARFYDPDCGRFLGKDPVEQPLLALDSRMYVESRPTVLVDPTGLLENGTGAAMGNLYGILDLILNPVDRVVTDPWRWLRDTMASVDPSLVERLDTLIGQMEDTTEKDSQEAAHISGKDVVYLAKGSKLCPDGASVVWTDTDGREKSLCLSDERVVWETPTGTHEVIKAGSGRACVGGVCVGYLPETYPAAAVEEVLARLAGGSAEVRLVAGAQLPGTPSPGGNGNSNGGGASTPGVPQTNVVIKSQGAK